MVCDVGLQELRFALHEALHPSLLDLIQRLSGRSAQILQRLVAGLVVGDDVCYPLVKAVVLGLALRQ
eukprot:7512846-Pyramimonas_sp.AAC.1